MTTDQATPGAMPDATSEPLPVPPVRSEDVPTAEGPAVVETPAEGSVDAGPAPATAARPPAPARRSPAPYVRAVRLTPARAPEPGAHTPPRRRAVSVTPVRLPVPRPEPTAPPTTSPPEEPQP
ncbi:hypothetical protein ACFUJR_33160 [Streptomyces sp. NPDC057271]|uniref:hypothetical protein n=1 Tax=unclassified Streptomyces TaxID=2593676 RepID=UPI0036392F52